MTTDDSSDISVVTGALESEQAAQQSELVGQLEFIGQAQTSQAVRASVKR